MERMFMVWACVKSKPMIPTQSFLVDIAWSFSRQVTYLHKQDWKSELLVETAQVSMKSSCSRPIDAWARLVISTSYPRSFPAIVPQWLSSPCPTHCARYLASWVRQPAPPSGRASPPGSLNLIWKKKGWELDRLMNEYVHEWIHSWFLELKRCPESYKNGFLTEQ